MVFFLTNTVLINPREKNPSKSIFVTATVYLETANDVITWVQSLLIMPELPESHGKQLIGNHVYAFNYLQLLYTTCCSRNNHFIIFNFINWSGRFFMHQHTPFHLCYPLNIGTRLVFLTCDLPANLPMLWTLDCPEVWASQTQQKRKNRAQVEKTLQFGALHRTAGLKIPACTEAEKSELS